MVPFRVVLCRYLLTMVWGIKGLSLLYSSNPKAVSLQGCLNLVVFMRVIVVWAILFILLLAMVVWSRFVRVVTI